MKIRFVPKVTVPHGRHLTAANAGRIVARSTVATDRDGNRLEMTPGAKPYFQTWRIIKDHPGWGKGYAFIEVTNGSGICGSAPTVRQLVIYAARFHYIAIEMEL